MSTRRMRKVLDKSFGFKFIIKGCVRKSVCLYYRGLLIDYIQLNKHNLNDIMQWINEWIDFYWR